MSKHINIDGCLIVRRTDESTNHLNNNYTEGDKYHSSYYFVDTINKTFKAFNTNFCVQDYDINMNNKIRFIDISELISTDRNNLINEILK